MELFGLWVLAGIVAHSIGCCLMEKWDPDLWKDPSMYLMFLPAMAAGPILFLLLGQYAKK